MEKENKIELFVADNSRNSITTLEADRVSEFYYWVRGNRFSLKTKSKNVFFSWRDAKDYLINHHTEKIAYHEKIICSYHNLDATFNFSKVQEILKHRSIDTTSIFDKL